MAEEMVSINRVVDLVKELARTGITHVGGPLMDCTGRCGCVSGDCGCLGARTGYGQSILRADLQAAREHKISALKAELAALERDSASGS
jgi:hypothetical protein